MNELDRLVAPLNTVLFHLGADAVTWAELLGFLTGAACVWLTVRSSIHNFWVGIANSAFFLVLFLSARLWSDSALQAAFIVLGFVGWWQWLHGAGRQPLVVRRASPPVLLGCVGFVLISTAVLTVVLRDAHDVAPFWDALTTSLSLAAQYLLNTKRVETWVFWIAADVVYVPLYFSKRLDLTGIVYVLFLALAVTGLRAWWHAYRDERATVEVPDLVAA
jgi:nicotinamide mononucleotide transporter